MSTMRSLVLILMMSFTLASYAQPASDLVEVYGLVTAKNEQGRYEYIPFVNIAVNKLAFNRSFY